MNFLEENVYETIPKDNDLELPAIFQCRIVLQFPTFLNEAHYLDPFINVGFCFNNNVLLASCTWWLMLPASALFQSAFTKHDSKLWRFHLNSLSIPPACIWNFSRIEALWQDFQSWWRDSSRTIQPPQCWQNSNKNKVYIASTLCESLASICPRFSCFPLLASWCHLLFQCLNRLLDKWN